MDWSKIPEHLWTYVAHGVEFSEENKDQWVGTAPFSEKENKFYVNPKNGLWDEKYAGVKGNDVSFLGQMSEHYRSLLTDPALEKLCDDRGLPPDAFTSMGVGFDGEHYFIPVYTQTGTVKDLKRWSFKRPRIMVTKGRKGHLYGLEELSSRKSEQLVYLCEGEWDRIALRWLFKRIKKKDGIVLAVPGATTFKAEWVPLLRGKKIVWMGDNDAAGDEGARIVRERFYGTDTELRYLNWPETWQEGYDIRDFVSYARKNSVKLSESWEKLDSLISSVHRRDDGTDKFSAKTDDDTDSYLSDSEAPTFEDLVAKFGEYLHMDEEMEKMLLFTVSLVYSQQIKTSEPLWAYLVAPAGGGKSVVLSSLGGHRKTFYRSAVAPNMLVSGFRSNADPSILPQVNGRTFVIKDFTATLSGPEHVFEETMAILRDAYDGDFKKSYGNDVVREYKNLHFSVIAGVTPVIHAKPQAMMGERFLKFCQREVGYECKIERLMATNRSVDDEAKMVEDLKETMARFLSRRFDTNGLPEIPHKFRMRLAALSLLVAKLRASVQRDFRDPDLLVYRPEAETGNRPMRQLCKLAQAVRFVLRKKEFDSDVWKTVERVALDSCVGFNIEIVQNILGRIDGTVSIVELSKALRLSTSTVSRALQDLEALRVVGKRAGASTGGRKPSEFYLDPETARSARIAGIYKSARGVGGRRARSLV